MMTLSVFGLYMGLGNELTVRKVMVSLAYFSQFGFSLMGIGFSCRRLFLTLLRERVWQSSGRPKSLQNTSKVTRKTTLVIPTKSSSSSETLH
eukprot:UN01656